MTLEEEVLQNAVQAVVKQIDFNVLADALGWTRVKIAKVSNDTLEWFDDNCQGEYRYHRDTFIFENPKDALIAKLMLGAV